MSEPIPADRLHDVTLEITGDTFAALPRHIRNMIEMYSIDSVVRDARHRQTGKVVSVIRCRMAAYRQDEIMEAIQKATPLPACTETSHA